MSPTATETRLPEGADPEAAASPETPADDVLADVLVEEISIDGMCGVY